MKKGHNYGICKKCGKDHGLHPSLGLYHTEEWKKIMSKAFIGDKNPNYGKTLGQETKNKMSEKAKKRWKNPIKREKFLSKLNTPKSLKINKIKAIERWKNPKIRAKIITSMNTPEFVEKISKIRKEIWKNPIFRKNMSKIQYISQNLPENIEKRKKSLKKAWKEGRYNNAFKSPTIIETKLYNFLDNMNIPYSTTKLINIGYKTRKPDAFILPNIIIEADGEYYHSEECFGKNLKAEDIKADKILKKMGYIIYRISERDFRNEKYQKSLNTIVSTII